MIHVISTSNHVQRVHIKDLVWLSCLVLIAFIQTRTVSNFKRMVWAINGHILLQKLKIFLKKSGPKHMLAWGTGSSNDGAVLEERNPEPRNALTAYCTLVNYPEFLHLSQPPKGGATTDMWIHRTHFRYQSWRMPKCHIRNTPSPRIPCIINGWVGRMLSMGFDARSKTRASLLRWQDTFWIFENYVIGTTIVEIRGAEEK